MEMEWEYAPVPQRQRRRRRILNAMGRRIKETYRYDTTFWRTALSGLWIVSFLAFTVTILGIPTGLGLPADILLAAGTGTIVLLVAGHILAALLALTGIRIARLFAGCLLADAIVILLILYYADVQLDAAAAIAVLLSLAGGAGGIVIGLLRSRRVAMALLLIAALTLSPLALASKVQETVVTDTFIPSSDEWPELAAANPGLPGDTPFTTFTYGSGQDLHRAEYAEGITLRSFPADASAYIKKWPRLRSLFWGFDSSSLPVNGRVFMPSGDGPYPLVLLVHGNHMMEDYSDAGYAYLGELLASRGFIAVALDQNFLNYSAWSGIPEHDFKVRAWMILKHLEQLGTYSEESGNPFYHKIDFGQTALLGHSRGGQAAAMAADAARWFKSDPVLTAAGRFHITSVIALAPTDKVVDGQQARLKDINYLTLQGARDGDVHDFYGDRQYNRSTYSVGSTAFKSSLYIADANHSQFNSDWGGYDQSLPAGLFLSRSRIMDGAAQRQLAKVYVSAFLEATLHGERKYEGLFRDYRSGQQWLPETTTYYNRFLDGSYRPVATFEEDRITSTAVNGTAESKGLVWTEELAKDRENKSKANYGIVLERTSAQDPGAYYSIALHNGTAAGHTLAGAEGLTFAMANRNADKAEAAGVPRPAPAVEIELTDRQGTSARLPLSEVMEVLPLPKTQFTLHPWLEERISDGKYGDLSEAVFQTYELPFELFREQAPTLAPDRLSQITFYLPEEGDKVMLDDIGFYAGTKAPR
ncbi:alpha/beta hydrolase [Paenibacillus albidus]|uniref:poly(ethylene terephthalate) hydrolase family protein n=1 Tax=Paenibacillus albidus TaxID=2041023 RepID=UPI001BE502CD|nr:alpha/beta hydrolase [Paenibacillus albidus]MBT2289976.1 alpha/beta hydrolase [Paenibacillus albidus]